MGPLWVRSRVASRLDQRLVLFPNGSTRAEVIQREAACLRRRPAPHCSYYTPSFLDPSLPCVYSAAAPWRRHEAARGRDCVVRRTVVGNEAVPAARRVCDGVRPVWRAATAVGAVP